MEQATPSVFRPGLFDDLPGVVAGFTTRHGGVSAAPFGTLNLGLSTGDVRDHVVENRRRLVGALGFELEQLAVAGQVHGDRVRVVDGGGLYPGFDALVTDRPGVLLCITAADCAVVLLADPARGVVGACHSGWRGTVAGIAAKTVAEMAALGADPSRLRAYVSPCISAAHFEVGPEVAAQFDPAFVHRPEGGAKPHVDLKGVLVAQLRAAGLAEGAVEVSPHCTFAQTDLFFSYRAERGETGRMMGFIGMKAAP